MSSADLPAEFRDNSSEDSDETTLVDNQGPKEQSKLAKLCEQTSSVLASVLPAPFGGHKRSILCQFFGQIPIKTSSTSQLQNKQQQSNNNNIVRQNNQLQPAISQAFDNMESIAVLHQAQQRPLTFYPNGKHPIQIVLEQQQQRQMVQQPNIAATNNGPISIFPLPSMRQVVPQEDLKSSASIVDYSYQQRLEPSNSLRKESSFSKNSQMKFSNPITSSSASFKPIQLSPSGQTLGSTSKPQTLISTSGWRIFNQPPQEVTSQQSVTTESSKLSSITNNRSSEENFKLSKSDQKDLQVKRVASKDSSTTATVQSTTPFLSSQYNINKATTSAPSMISINKNGQQETLNFGSAQLLVMGKPPGFDSSSLEANRSSLKKAPLPPAAVSSVNSTNQKYPSTIGKRSEILKSTTRVMENNNDISGNNNSSSKSARNLGSSSPAQDVRIIEVVAQQSNSSSSSLVSNNNNQVESVVKTISSEQGSKLSPNSTVPMSNSQKQTTSTDLHQVQRREELVIASINNLTRIAFGNQLRDTVKVINKLIDQQADLFGRNLNRAEPLVTSESRQMVTGNMSLGDGGEINGGTKNNDKLTKQVSSSTKSNQTGVSYRGKFNKFSNEKSIRQKQDLHSSSQALSIKPTKKPKKQPVSLSSTTGSNKSAVSLPSEIAKESIKPKAATFSSQKLTTSLPSTISRGLLRSTQSRSSRNIERVGPKKSASDEAHSSSSSVANSRAASNLTSARTTSKHRTPSTSTMSDLDPIIPIVTIKDIHRDKSPWKFSPSPYIRDLSSPSLMKKSSTSFDRGYGNKSNDAKSKTATTFPWMLPETSSNYESDLFGTTLSSMRKSTTGDTLRRWTSSRKYPTSASLSKQPLIFNKLDNKLSEPKMDSLTTLKMSLTTQPSLIIQSSSMIPASTSVSVPSISSSQNGGSTQSRWIPSSSISARPQSISTSAITSSPPTSSSISITTTAPTPTTTRASSVENTQSTVTATGELSNSMSSHEPINQNDLNEARASDSISRYTTHWNEANEILSTTRRFFQQPLPQIAQTGEFFNAETISTWPERYQTMLNGEGKTTPSFETTRRNGETYEKSSTNLARHKFDTSVTASTSEQFATGRTSRVDPVLANLNNSMSSITILPYNHKLTTSFGGDQNNGITKQTTVAGIEEQYNTNSYIADESRDKTQSELYTQDTTNEMIITETSTVPPVRTQQKSLVPSTAVSYTLIGPYTNFKPEQKQEGVVAVGRTKFPRILGDYLLPSDTNQQAKDDFTVLSGSGSGNTNNNVGINNNSNSNSFLKPPYLESHHRDREHDIPTSNLSSLEKQNVSRKLYELLVPSTKNFVGPQNPLNLQRFNLSALKFLAHNILMPNNSQRNFNTGINSTKDRGMSEIEEFSIDDINSKNNQEQLLDLLNPSSPMNYYDLSSNETSQANRTSGKSILGRAGNLLNDLRQMESKRAAALLAAIRYQVPSPLVRPWDTVSDNYHLNGLLNSNERLDGSSEDIGGKEGEIESVSLRDSLLLAQLSNAVKSALFRQRIVPKDVLEARLKLQNNHPFVVNEEQDISLDRRSDSQSKPSKIDSYSFDEDDFGNETKSGAEYLNGNLTLRSGRNFTKNLLNTLLNSTPLKLPTPFNMRANNKTKNGFVDQVDFSAIQLQQQQQNESQNSSEQPQYPKYIRLTDNKAAWSLNSEGSLKATSRQPSLPSSAVAAKLRDSTSRNRKAVVKQDSDLMMPQGVENKDKAKSIEFDCDGKHAGFYPDVDTACQVSLE